jgi:hypothetical protein
MVLVSIQQMRRIRHPKVLKVNEICDSQPDIGFASDPTASLAEVGDMHPMDLAYISCQLAEVFSFLNEEARLVHLHLTSSSVLADD